MSIIDPFNPGLLGSLSAEASVARFRELLYCEARYVGIRPDAITISANLYVSDGGIDAQVESTVSLPPDTFFKFGRTGFQLKTGTSFKPWQASSLKDELLTATGDLASEVRRTLEAEGHYLLICFGLDLTPEQRNDSRIQLAGLFEEFGFPNTSERVEVFGQCQIAPYFDRYPSLRLSLLGGADEDFLSVSEWLQHAHMSNPVILSEDQAKLVDFLREKLRGETKHIRILGEPGIGKTRLVLEAVRAEEFVPSVLYVQHGARFSQTRLFRELLREMPTYPSILILDELSEREMSEIWGHLKNRCGALKLISLDHGPNRSRDPEIESISAPRLPDETIKQILHSHVGENQDIDRWVKICEGSPRVAQAVGENLGANPEDILKPPATVPIWDRFLFGYAQQQGDEARQIALVMRHIALFTRFGFEAPVGSEAEYIAKLVERSDVAVTWARFQEIVQTLRDRRILQGDRTLFIVPWALHIHLWREYWRCYGRGFDFAQAFNEMPGSLHGWFMDMFQFAHGTSAAPVVREILRRDGVYANRDFLCSDKGTSFLSTLSEADPDATLTLIERTFGSWPRVELHAFEGGRQKIVWTLEKIAVWTPTFIRAARMLVQLAVTENATNSNNSTGTLLGLFRIGPENAATEASPIERLPILLELLRSDDDLKRVGLKVAESALQASGRGFRMVGPEYQGIKERAVLWVPKTYGEWWAASRAYWDCLINETRGWPDALRREANSTIIDCAAEQLRIHAHREEVLSMLEQVADDPATDIRRLNHFFIQQARWHRDEDDQSVHFRLRRLEGRLTRSSLESRFQRYVLDTTWDEWEDYSLEGELREHSRPKRLVRALAVRVAGSDEDFACLLPMLVGGTTETAALFAFGQSLCAADEDNQRLLAMLEFEGDAINSQCLGGYLAGLREGDPAKWQQVLLGLLASKDTANRGADLVWRSGADDCVLNACMDAFEAGWIEADYFRSICYGVSWQSASQANLTRLLSLLASREDQVSAYVLVDLLNQMLKEGNIWLVDSDFVFKVVTEQVHFEGHRDTMHSYHWNGVCNKLVKHDPAKAMPLLDVLLRQMGNDYSLSYDREVEPLAHSLCKINPTGAWAIIAAHLLEPAPKWRGDLLNWLKGGFGGLGNQKELIPPIAEFPVQMVLDWVALDVEARASMIAHCAANSLDDKFGGELTRALLANYRTIDGVEVGISCNFGSGGWTGPRSKHLRARRDRFRAWLSQGFDVNVMNWIEEEIVDLDREIEAAEISEEREAWSRP